MKKNSKTMAKKFSSPDFHPVEKSTAIISTRWKSAGLSRIAPALILLTGVFAPSVSTAQLEVSMKLPHRILLRYEAIPVVVTVVNKSGRQIPLSATNGYSFDFDIQAEDGRMVGIATQHPPVVAPVLLRGVETSFTNDLFRSFQIGGVNQASIVARINYGGMSYLSHKQFIDIRTGAEIAHLQTSAGNSTFNHQLRVMERDDYQNLFLRVDDATGGWTYGAVDLGPFINMNPPTIMSDHNGMVHVLHQSAPQEYIYNIAAPNGTIDKTEKFTGDYQIVQMTTDAQGAVNVSGRPGNKNDREPVLQATPFRPDMHR